MINKFLTFLVIMLLVAACDQSKQVQPVSPRCIDGQSHCSIELGDMTVNVNFTRERLVAEQAFQVVIDINTKANIESLSAYMEGEDMFMGKIPLLFEKSGKNQFVANGLFGSCGQVKMTWRVWLFIDGHKQSAVSLTVPSYLR